MRFWQSIEPSRLTEAGQLGVERPADYQPPADENLPRFAPVAFADRTATTRP